LIVVGTSAPGRKEEGDVMVGWVILKSGLGDLRVVIVSCGHHRWMTSDIIDAMPGPTHTQDVGI
jgi:hypothetical protein